MRVVYGADVGLLCSLNALVSALNLMGLECLFPDFWAWLKAIHTTCVFSIMPIETES